MSLRKPLEATPGAFGGLDTDSPSCRPLDTVTVHVQGRARGDERCTVRVCDPDQQPYFEQELELRDNQGSLQFLAAGPLGNHYIYVTFPGESYHSRYLNFHLDCETAVESGDSDFDPLYPFTRDRMLLGRREYETPRGRFVGYISADTLHLDGIWLRDWIYGLPAYKYWELDMQCGLDRFIEAQHENGMIPDGIERNGGTWRAWVESDVEYIMTLGVWQTWKVTGDDAWMAGALPALERALAYVQRDERVWDPGHQLVKRQHSCDTWDFDIDSAGDLGGGRHVIANCDQSGYYVAFRAMGEMYAHLGRTDEAEAWTRKAEAYRQRAVELLWDGTKFLHHVHLDEIDHDGFDETGQLTMGNTWAMTRGLASPEQARSIIDEYRRRHAETGDAYPWWSLQPGYPDELGYWSAPFLKQGAYANGGLMPWVGGELCRAALLNGREDYGVELLRQWAEHLRRTGGAHVWYWPDGEPGFRTTNEVPYAGWGMGEWTAALVEGLAGITDSGGQMRTVQVNPRWAAAGVAEVRTTVRYAANRAYFAYRLRTDRRAATLRLDFTGSGEQARFAVLLPRGWQPTRVSLDERPVEFKAVSVDASVYVAFGSGIAGAQAVIIECETD